MIYFVYLIKCTSKTYLYTVSLWINLSYNVYVFLPSLCPGLHLCLPQLAQQGMNVVIISRSRADLDLVAKGISKNLTYIC